MPRPRSGLGQGLEALVPPLREDAPSLASFPVPGSSVGTRWEVATLRRRKRRRCVLTIAPAGLLKAPKRRKLRASLLLSLGALGASGWELVAARGQTFYLKRPVAKPADE